MASGTTFAQGPATGTTEAKVVSAPTFWALRFDVAAADADRWSDALLAAGALSVDAADPFAGTDRESAIFGEPSEAPRDWWHVTRLTALCAGDADPAAIVRTAADAVASAEPPFERYRVPDRDWVRTTRAQFAPLRITDALWIVPSWCTPPRPDATNILLDPGLAFGTGAHPTTRLCLRFLADESNRGDSVLDYGCGSGILAIAAAKLGAGRVAGVDIDPQAISASIENGRANRVRAQFVHVDALGEERFAIVVANILANPLRVLAPALAARTEDGGRIALSGILAAQAGDVARDYAPWFDIAAGAEDDGWVLLTGTRRTGNG
ncbi:MAG TPA: 50S ribosomal protein L11 methyltransferase [Casimicrobiaceae bacterium]